MAEREPSLSPEALGQRFFSLRRKVRGRLLLGVLLKLDLEHPAEPEAWLLVRIHGWTFEAAAEKLGVKSTRTVFSRQETGQQRLRELSRCLWRRTPNGSTTNQEKPQTFMS